jgi:hypothetical protein
MPILSQIRKLIPDRHPRAQRLAAEAATRFPDHEDIQSAHRVLNGPRGPVGTVPAEPPVDEELDWLRNAPESLRGQWVAVSGSKMLAAAEDFDDLMEELRARYPRTKTVVHLIE